MNYQLTSEASRELDQAAAYVNEQAPGLGKLLIEEFHEGISDVMIWPQANPLVAPNQTRRKRLKRFQYGIVYQVHHQTIHVLAFMHLHRDPDYWKDRV